MLAGVTAFVLGLSEFSVSGEAQTPSVDQVVVAPATRATDHLVDPGDTVAALGGNVLGIGNDRFEHERPAFQPRAWKEFLESDGNPAYLASLDPEELVACPDCVFAFRAAVQSQQLDPASVLTIAGQMAASSSIDTASAVLGLAKAWESQPLGSETGKLAKMVIDRHGTSPQGLDAIARQDAEDSLTDTVAIQLSGLLAADERHTQALLTDPDRPEATIHLLARLAPIRTVCQAIQEADNSRATVLRSIVISEQGQACF